jgi:hypothetical protein
VKIILSEDDIVEDNSKESEGESDYVNVEESDSNYW